VQEILISGELEWAVDGAWEPRHVEVRDGSLVVYSTSTGPELRLPLRHLSLQPASHPRTFSLVREHQPLATLQVGYSQPIRYWARAQVGALLPGKGKVPVLNKVPSRENVFIA